MRAATFAIALTLLPVVAQAQIGNPTFMAPDTKFDGSGMPEPNQPNTADKLFAQLVTEGGLAEVELGELAAGKAQATEVGDFARMMVNDHTMANDQLTTIAGDQNIPLPDKLNPEHAAKRAQLEDLDGADFDLEYMRSQVVDHQKATQILVWEIGNGQEGEMQRFAAATLPTVIEHLRMAREIVDKLSRDQVSATTAQRN